MRLKSQTGTQPLQEYQGIQQKGVTIEHTVFSKIDKLLQVGKEFTKPIYILYIFNRKQ